MQKRINRESAESMKAKNQARTDALRLIKAELISSEKSCNPEPELKILLSMKKRFSDSLEIFQNAGEKERAAELEYQISVISEFLPAEDDPKEVEKFIQDLIKTEYGGKAEMKDMRTILPRVQEKFPMTTGKIVSEFIKKSTLE